MDKSNDDSTLKRIKSVGWNTFKSLVGFYCDNARNLHPGRGAVNTKALNRIHRKNREMSTMVTSRKFLLLFLFFFFCFNVLECVTFLEISRDDSKLWFFYL